MRGASHRSLSERPPTYFGTNVPLDAGLGRIKSTDFAGYSRSVRIGFGPEAWTSASSNLLRWEVKARSGFSVWPMVNDSQAPIVKVGQRYWLIAHVGPVRIGEPVEVVEVADESNLKAFSYRTLAGHPIKGEEAFIIDRREDGSVWFTVRSVSSAGDGVWRVAYPLLRAAQPLYRRRYFKSLAQ
ncbi:DUF1990 family protein [Nocardioides sp. Root224]